MDKPLILLTNDDGIVSPGLAAAAKALLPEKLVIDTASETVERFRQVWEREKAHLPLAPTVVKAVDAHVSTVPLFREG